MNSHTCKHYNGTTNRVCCAGVKYLSVTSEPERMFGSAFRKPCIQWDKYKDSKGGLSPKEAAEYAKRGTCDKFELPTEEEIKSHHAKTHNSIAQMFKARAAIVKELDRRNEDIDVSVQFVERSQSGDAKNFVAGAGKMQCPICGGELAYSRAAYNGHIHASCSSDGCVRWME